MFVCGGLKLSDLCGYSGDLNTGIDWYLNQLNFGEAGSRFVIEANHKPLQPKSNSRRSKKMMVWGQSIQPRSEYQSEYWIALGQISKGIRLGVEANT